MVIPKREEFDTKNLELVLLFPFSESENVRQEQGQAQGQRQGGHQRLQPLSKHFLNVANGNTRSPSEIWSNLFSKDHTGRHQSINLPQSMDIKDNDDDDDCRNQGIHATKVPILIQIS
jgi:hypothetical protein